VIGRAFAKSAYTSMAGMLIHASIGCRLHHVPLFTVRLIAEVSVNEQDKEVDWVEVRQEMGCSYNRQMPVNSLGSLCLLQKLAYRVICSVFPPGHCFRVTMRHCCEYELCTLILLISYRSNMPQTKKVSCIGWPSARVAVLRKKDCDVS